MGPNHDKRLATEQVGSSSSLDCRDCSHQTIETRFSGELLLAQHQLVSAMLVQSLQIENPKSVPVFKVTSWQSLWVRQNNTGRHDLSDQMNTECATLVVRNHRVGREGACLCIYLCVCLSGLFVLIGGGYITLKVGKHVVCMTFYNTKPVRLT